MSCQKQRRQRRTNRLKKKIYGIIYFFLFFGFRNMGAAGFGMYRAREEKWHAGSRMAVLVREFRLRVLYFGLVIVRVLCCH